MSDEPLDATELELLERMLDVAEVTVKAVVDKEGATTVRNMIAVPYDPGVILSGYREIDEQGEAAGMVTIFLDLETAESLAELLPEAVSRQQKRQNK